MKTLFTALRARVSAPKNPPRRGGFTLVEMLVVIVIIAVLVAMLGGAFMQARNHAKRGRAETQLRELTKAWTTYYMTYTNWPAVVANYNGGAGEGVDVPMTYDALTPLFAEGNSNGIPFLSISPSSFRTYSTGQACYTDPWWTPQDSYPKRAYKITFRKSTDYQETALRISVGFPNRDRYR